MFDHRARLLADDRGLSFELLPLSQSWPQGIDDLFGAERNFYLTYDWFRNVAEHGLSANSEAFWGVLKDGDFLLAVIPLERTEHAGFSSLTNCYTSLYRPLISPKAQPRRKFWHM